MGRIAGNTLSSLLLLSAACLVFPAAAIADEPKAATVRPPLPVEKLPFFEPEDQSERFADLFYDGYRDAVEQALRIPEFPENAQQRALSAWSVIGSGVYFEEGLPAGMGKHRAGRIKIARYAYDDEQEAWTLYLGASSGGLWKQIDAAPVTVWKPISERLNGSPSVGDFAVSSLGSNSILIGTGDRGRYPGDGFYWTTDGGDSWTRATLSPDDEPDHVERIAVDRISPTRALAATETGIWITEDFGKSWTRAASWAATDVIQSPLDPDRWLAGRRFFGLMESLDDGVSWSPLDGDGGQAGGLLPPIDSIYLAISDAAPNYVFALVSGNASCSSPAPANTSCRFNSDCSAFAGSTCVATIPANNLNNVYRSSDQGHNWIGIEAVDRLTGQAWHAHAIGVDPDDPDHLWVGMARPQRTINATAPASQVLWQRPYQANNCDADGDGNPDPPQTSACDLDRSHPDYTSFVFVPDEVEPDSNKVIVTNDGGYWVYRTDTNTIQGEGNVAGLTISQTFEKIGTFTQSSLDTDRLFSGMQDLSMLSIEPNEARPIHMLNDGDGGKVVAHSRNPDRILFSHGDGGNSNRFSSPMPPWQVANWSSIDFNLPQEPFAVPVGIDNPSVTSPLMFTSSSSTGSATLYFASDSMPTWLPVHTQPISSDRDGDGDQDPITRIEWIDVASDPTCRILYVTGIWDSRLFGLTDCTGQTMGSLTPFEITPPDIDPTSSSNPQVYADRSILQPRTIYWASNDPQNLWVSRGAGLPGTWKNVLGNLATRMPAVRVRELIGDPTDETRLFVATNVGIFRTEDADALDPTWNRYMNGLPRVVDVRGIEIAFDQDPMQLRIATYGRGFWERALLESIGGAVVEGPNGEPPLRVDRADAGQIELTWNPSCAPGDDDYAIYEGSLGNFDSHIPAFCSTGGATTKTYTTGVGSRYFLIVPLASSNGSVTEGSIGETGSGDPRPRGAQQCYPSPLIQECPTSP